MLTLNYPWTWNMKYQTKFNNIQHKKHHIYLHITYLEKPSKNCIEEFVSISVRNQFHLIPVNSLFNCHFKGICFGRFVYIYQIEVLDGIFVWQLTIDQNWIEYQSKDSKGNWLSFVWMGRRHFRISIVEVSNTSEVSNNKRIRWC